MAVAKFRDKTRMKNAMKVQDKIRKGTKGDISLTKEIRKWRDPSEKEFRIRMKIIYK